MFGVKFPWASQTFLCFEINILFQSNAELLQAVCFCSRIGRGDEDYSRRFQIRYHADVLILDFKFFLSLCSIWGLIWKCTFTYPKTACFGFRIEIDFVTFLYYLIIWVFDTAAIYCEFNFPYIFDYCIVPNGIFVIQPSV